jgi:hypothetical protein
MTLYSLVHGDAGPVATFTTEAEAQRELEAVLRDEPDWIEDLSIEPFELIVADPVDPAAS